MFCSLQSFSQTLKENKIDEFTKDTIKRTSWKSLRENMFETYYFRISKINNSYYFGLKIMLNNTVFSIDKENELAFKLENDSIITLNNLQYKITSYGDGAISPAGSASLGIHVEYAGLNKILIDTLKKHKVVKIRIYFIDKYKEVDINDKHAQFIINALNLIK